MELTEKLLLLETLIIKLSEELSFCKTTITSLEAENALLRLENLELKRQLGQNSENSNKPPSTDEFVKPKKDVSLREKTGKKVGGQQGHKGHYLEMSEKIDKIIVHSPLSCSCCGKALDETSNLGVVDTRQVFDMPSPKLEVISHQITQHQCSCGKVEFGTYPLEIKSKTQYGENILTICNILTNECRVSYQKSSQILSDIFGCSLNVGTIINANEKLYENLDPIEHQIKEAIKQAEVVHFDETGMRVEGKLHWFHVACTDLYTYLFVHQKRGLEALRSDESLLKDFSGTAVHDCWASYFNFYNCKHALCNAHILRELKALMEAGSIWAKNMSNLLKEMYQRSETGTQSLENPAYFLRMYDYICKIGEKEEPPPSKSKNGKLKSSKGRNLLNRLKNYQAEVIAFAQNENIPFTNNEAERAIRHVKIKQKVSMCFRTFEGAKMYARIQSVIDTIKKNGLNVFQTLKNINLNQNFSFFQRG
ncbi:MAG: IS66 family transposase [Bacteroidota bacterium]|nr:IS66 family transposase [Bacteroidota bacterium]